MSQRLWLLVEWLDEDNVFPCYGIVHIDRFAYRGSDISLGKEILLRVKVNEPRRAKIVQVADNKQDVEDQKMFLERQEQRVKHVLENCMRRIEALQSAQECKQPAHGCHKRNTKERNAFPVIISTNSDEGDSSDQDAETTILSYNNQPSHSAVASQCNSQRMEITKTVTQTFTPALTQRRRSIVSSTPLPDSRQQENTVKLCFDQGTQTDNLDIHKTNLKKIVEMEAALLKLHERFQSLVNHAQECDREVKDEEIDSSTTDDTTNSSNSSCVEDNTAEVNNTQQNVVIPRQMPSTSTVKIEDPGIGNAENQPCSSNVTQVRRMSAQTTDSLDLVPIGDGHAMIPARILNEIDFRSYTTATRQLLQAIFSRQVLATHSLTGRQSPAHTNKPPKKILDPKLVNDIVKTVVTRCGVSTSLARNCITVKCTDEAKLYRNRQVSRENRQRKPHRNDENITPSLHTSSDELN